MIFIFDKNMGIIDEIAKDEVITATETIKLNNTITFDLSFPYARFNQQSSYFGYIKNDSLVSTKNFMIYKIINSSRESGTISLTGIHILFDDLKGNIIRDKRPNNTTALNAISTVLDGTQWSVVSTAKGLNSTNFYNISSLEALYKVLDLWKVEMYPEINLDNGEFKKILHIEDNISKDNGKWYEYGDKLISVVAEENHSDIYTAFIGLGKGEEVGDGYGRKIKFTDVEWSVDKGNPINKPIGQDYVEIAEATKLYGYPTGKPRITTVDFSDIEDSNILLEETYKVALENSRPKLQLKATAIDDEKVDIGEIATIIRPDLDIRYKTRVFEVSTNLINGLQTFQFGDKIVISQSDRVKLEKAEKQKIVENFESKMEKVINNITLDYFNEDGYNYELKANNEYNLPAGYYSFDKPIEQFPTKLVYVGAGKVLISDVKDSNGQWIFRTAITPDGISGEEIITNSITANKLSADVGQELDLSSNVSIISTVSQEDFSSFMDEEIKPIKEQFSQINQNKESIETIIADSGKYMTQSQTVDTIQTIFGNTEELANKTAQELEEIKTAIKTGVDENGNTYTQWGSDKASVRVGSDGIEMTQGETPIMTLKDGLVTTTSLYVSNEIGFGNHTAQKYGTVYTIFAPNGGN